MLRSQSPFPHSGDLPGLTPSEKADGWKAVQSFIEEERVVADLLAPLQEVALSPEEKAQGWTLVQEHVEQEQTVALFLSEGTQECLSPAEKADVWKAVARKESLAEVSHTEPWYERAIEYVNVALRFGWAMPALAIVLLVTTVGASYASADSLPGDFLYPVKKVGEQLWTGIHLTTESQAEVEADRMNRRVSEKERLAQESKLNDDLRESLEQEFKLERRTALKHIQALDEAGNEAAASRIRARLNALQDRFDRVTNGVHAEDAPRKQPSDFPTVKDED